VVRIIAELVPDSVQALGNRAAACIMLLRPRMGLDDCTRVLELEPTNVKVRPVHLSSTQSPAAVFFAFRCRSTPLFFVPSSFAGFG
jgi:hypothetical protein